MYDKRNSINNIPHTTTNNKRNNNVHDIITINRKIHTRHSNNNHNNINSNIVNSNGNDKNYGVNIMNTHMPPRTTVIANIATAQTT